MNKVFMLRDTKRSDVTLSRLIAPGGKWFHILEPPWRDNKTNVSCIPPGQYRCQFLKRSASGKYRNVYHVLQVRDRSGILIHQGNLVEHTWGCLIIGTRRGNLAGKPAVLNSVTALRQFVKIMGTEPFTLTIWE